MLSRTATYNRNMNTRLLTLAVQSFASISSAFPLCLYTWQITETCSYLIIKVTVNVMLKFRFHVILVRIEHVLSTIYNSSILISSIQRQYIHCTQVHSRSYRTLLIAVQQSIYYNTNLVLSLSEQINVHDLYDEIGKIYAQPE